MSRAADKNGVILIRADGSAKTNDGSWFGGSAISASVMPGDSIVVPDKLDMEATWSTVVRNTRDLTQIFYQLGLGAASLTKFCHVQLGMHTTAVELNLVRDLGTSILGGGAAAANTGVYPDGPDVITVMCRNIGSGSANVFGRISWTEAQA
jgi:hypothetical protein